MSNEKGGVRERIWTSWREKWRIPSADLGSVLFVFAMFALFFVWLGLSVFGVEDEAIRAAHGFFPQWFFFANLFLTPAVLVFVAGPLPVPRILRLTLAVVMLCSGSLFVVTPQHQAAGLAMLGFLCLEAFWIIPRWNRWAARKNAGEGMHGSGGNSGSSFGLLGKTEALPKPNRKHRLRDFVLYMIIAAGIVTILLVGILR